MAVYTHPSTTYPALPWTDITIGGEGLVLSESATLFVILNSDGTETRLIGSGFTYDGTGHPTGGTVDTITRTSSGGGTIYEQITGDGGGSLGVGITNLSDASNAPGGIFNFLFQGADTLTGS